MMRDQVEVQRLHDLLNDVLEDVELRQEVIPDPWVRPLMLVADCLCWLLRHEGGDHGHATNFSNIIGMLEADLADLGKQHYEVGRRMKIIR